MEKNYIDTVEKREEDIKSYHDKRMDQSVHRMSKAIKGAGGKSKDIDNTQFEAQIIDEETASLAKFMGAKTPYTLGIARDLVKSSYGALREKVGKDKITDPTTYATFIASLEGATQMQLNSLKFGDATVEKFVKGVSGRYGLALAADKFKDLEEAKEAYLKLKDVKDASEKDKKDEKKQVEELLKKYGMN